MTPLIQSGDSMHGLWDNLGALWPLQYVEQRLVLDTAVLVVSAVCLSVFVICFAELYFNRIEYNFFIVIIWCKQWNSVQQLWAAEKQSVKKHTEIWQYMLS